MLSIFSLKIIFYIGLVFVSVAIINIFYPAIGYFFGALIADPPLMWDIFPSSSEYDLYAATHYFWSVIWGVLGLVLAGSAYYQMKKYKSKI